MAAAKQGLADRATAGAVASVRWSPAQLMPLIGPVVLFVMWDLVVRYKLISPILLPSPSATLTVLFTGMAGGELLKDFASGQMTQIAIAKKYNVSPARVYAIIKKAKANAARTA